jgi:DNA polymerase III delta subunit
MVSLTQYSGQKLEKADIIELCHGYGGDSMYALSDAVMTMNITLALDILHRITQTAKIDEWFGSWMGNLRNTLYIRYLREHGERESDIIEITRLHPFVIKK